jgi:hypothetical protein
MAYGPTSSAYAGLYLESTEIGETLSDENHGRFSQSTIRAIVHDSRGQRVMAKNNDHDANYDAGWRNAAFHYTAISGFLIKAD